MTLTTQGLWNSISALGNWLHEFYMEVLDIYSLLNKCVIESLRAFVV
jgi:hypothetical protein